VVRSELRAFSVDRPGTYDGFRCASRRGAYRTLVVRFTHCCTEMSCRGCKHRCKRSATVLIRRPVGAVRLRRLALGRIAQGQVGQHIEGSIDIQQPRVGVDAHRELDVAVPHGGLGCSRCHACLAQMGAEGGSENRSPLRVNSSAPVGIGLV